MIFRSSHLNHLINNLDLIFDSRTEKSTTIQDCSQFLALQAMGRYVVYKTGLVGPKTVFCLFGFVVFLHSQLVRCYVCWF